jgi:ABC-type tungstate transport system permease subunit
MRIVIQIALTISASPSSFHQAGGSPYRNLDDARRRTCARNPLRPSHGYAAAMRIPACLLGVASAMVLLAPAPASADTPSTLTVVGTSDISDSGLFQHVLQPQFKAAFPQYTLKYVGSASVSAIQNAETGTGGPSALIIHDASLESQFVTGGFSYNAQLGNAIFADDFVLAGPTTDADHADITANASHNVAQAFADIASAGVAGNATFITRGGATTAPSATVEEHAIWALVADSGLVPAGVVLCNVSAADGGGMSPIKPTVQGTSGQLCPDDGTVASSDAPDWYQINGVNQAANVVAANACTLGSSGVSSCYVLTDRGTFDYLLSGNDPAGTIPNLTILAREDSASAPGGANELVNHFHVYIVNPSSPSETVNLQGAQDFVSFLTSPALQSQLGIYLNTAGDPEGPPFKADASPTVTSTPSRESVLAGQPVTVTGSVVNNEPGYPALAGKPVTVDQLVGSTSTPVGSGATDANGNYSVTFTPAVSGSYQVTTGQISQIEDMSLSPFYEDLLSPAASAPFSVAVIVTAATAPSGSTAPASSVLPSAPAVATTVNFKKITVKDGSVTVSGALGSAPATGGAMVRLFALTTGEVSREQAKSASAATQTKAPTFKQAAKVTLKIGAHAFTIKHKFGRGFRYVLQLEYVHTGQISTDSKYRYIEVR